MSFPRLLVSGRVVLFIANSTGDFSLPVFPQRLGPTILKRTAAKLSNHLHHYDLQHRALCGGYALSALLSYVRYQLWSEYISSAPDWEDRGRFGQEVWIHALLQYRVVLVVPQSSEAGLCRIAMNLFWRREP